MEKTIRTRYVKRNLPEGAVAWHTEKSNMLGVPSDRYLYQSREVVVAFLEFHDDNIIALMVSWWVEGASLCLQSGFAGDLRCYNLV